METINIKSIAPKAILELGKNQKVPVPKAAETLYIVFGVANGLMTKPSAFDADQQVICGRFEAVRAKDQQRFSAMQLYLPGDQHKVIVNALLPNADTGLIPELQLAFKIGYRPEETPTGYAWTCEPVLDTRAQDLLADTRRQVDGMLAKLLPAPAKAK